MNKLPDGFRKDFRVLREANGKSFDFTFLLIGPKGATQFRFSIYQINQELRTIATDLGYHSPKPMYKGQDVMVAKCKHLNCPCYYDGSSLNAERIWEQFEETNNDEIIWDELMKYYNYTFEENKIV